MSAKRKKARFRTPNNGPITKRQTNEEIAREIFTSDEYAAMSPEKQDAVKQLLGYSHDEPEDHFPVVDEKAPWE